LVDLYGAPPPRSAAESWARLEACIERGGAALVRDDAGGPVAIVLQHLHGRRLVDARLPAARQAAALMAVDEASTLEWMRALYQSLEGSRVVLSERVFALEHPPQPSPEPAAPMEWPTWYRPRRRRRAGAGNALIDFDTDGLEL